jgi:tripartite-type tricarboxylate transporter receptor subunit TctC
MQDLLGGQIDLICDQTTNTTNQIRSGKIKVYAVTTTARLPTMKDVPTLAARARRDFQDR